MKFCPQCGEPLLAGAKFCVECGRELSGATSGAGPAAWFGGHARESVLRSNPITMGFAVVFIGITVCGLLAAGWIYFRTPAMLRQELASAPPVLPTTLVPDRTADGKGAVVKAAAAGKQTAGLPPGHPHIELPTQARSYIDQVEKKARAKPKDVAAWDKFGDVSMRAAMFDASYYGKAEAAYGHVLKLDSEDLDALRGIGDIDYDRQHYDQAVAAYEHYLKRKPADPEVRTDLGTMYLYTGNADQAIVQYEKAISYQPDFFQAYYNMGIAYAQENKPDLAVGTLKKALSLAPDDTTRGQLKQLIAKLAPGSAAPSASAEEAQASAAPAASAAAPAAKSFDGEVDAAVRGLPIAGSKVDSIQWPGAHHAKITFRNFPMDEMPSQMKGVFLADLKSRIDAAKQDHKVADKVQVDLVDGASGRVMATVSD
ncbi:MAG: tetratricopeptide repeat protein [Candidatus Binataceae bacterium]